MPAMQARISAIIITRNEQATIADCLANLGQFADEIIVVDSYSDDQTIAIAESFGARTFQHTWMGFSATKNYANTLASNSWLISVDADEVFSPELIASIKSLKESGLNEGCVYEFARLTYFCGRAIHHCGWYPDYKPRLFHRDHARWKGDFVHEQLDVGPGILVHRLSGDLLHYSFPDEAAYLRKNDRYSLLSAEERFRRGKSASRLREWFGPLWRFVQVYALRSGFLDGSAGLRIALLSAREKRMKESRLRQLWNQ